MRRPFAAISASSPRTCPTARAWPRCALRCAISMRRRLRSRPAASMPKSIWATSSSRQPTPVARPSYSHVDRAGSALHGPAGGTRKVQVELIPNAIVEVGEASFGNTLPLSLIAGPCALESRAHALETALALKEIAARTGIGLVYKTSFDKANRTSAKSARGLGLDQALPIFAGT